MMMLNILDRSPSIVLLHLSSNSVMKPATKDESVINWITGQQNICVVPLFMVDGSVWTYILACTVFMTGKMNS